MFRSQTLATAVVALSVAFSLVGCGEDATTRPETTQNQPPDFDVNGTWSLWETVVSNCGAGDEERSYDIVVAQDGNDLTVSTPIGVFSGTISGSTIGWSGRFPEEGGMTTINSMTLTVRAVGDGDLILDGSSLWTWSDGSFSCSGSTTVDGVHQGF